MNKLEDQRKIYEDMDIPEELEMKVRESIKRVNKKNSIRITQKVAVAVIAIFLFFAGMVNLNQNFAIAMSELPIVGAVVQVISYHFDTVENENVNANIEVPVITGLTDEGLASELNAKYYEESQELYDDFMADMEEIIEMGGHLGVDSGYVVKTDTDDLLSIGRYVVNTVGSSSTTFQYDTIDKEAGVLITLPSLFKDERYVERISEYLILTMKEEMRIEDNKVYWVREDDFYTFETINLNQSFYITSEGKLVISFDKYEVAPGYMGVLTFEIPTEVIEDLLVSARYIK
ncbi:MAG: anti-sigma factor [Firmicutes bacterium HGW-Firmicutes-7]|nr:MAG: anti-sigma factor [Firmicutes bacterium HGW-Firmicutes-7]